MSSASRAPEACPVVLLCGGMGTRIADASRTLPKPLLPIGGMPILWHIMKMYSQHGFKDFILCLGHLGEQIECFFREESFVGDADAGMLFRPSKLCERWEPDWNITFAYTGETTPTGGRVKRIEDAICGPRFMLTYGDGLADLSFAALQRFHGRLTRAATVTGVRPQSTFGVLEIEQGLATSFVEKPVMDQRINGGFFVFERQVFDYIGPDDALEDGPLRRLVADRQLAVYEHDGFWRCMDTRKDLEALNAMWDCGQTPWKTW